MEKKKVFESVHMDKIFSSLTAIYNCYNLI